MTLADKNLANCGPNHVPYNLTMTRLGPSDPPPSWLLPPMPGLPPPPRLSSCIMFLPTLAQCFGLQSQPLFVLFPCPCALPSVHLPSSSPLFQVSFKAPLQSLSGPPSTGNADLFLRLLPSPGRFLRLFNIHPFCTCLVGARHGARCWGHSSDSGSDHGRGLRRFHLLMRALGIREVKDWPRLSQTVHGRPRIDPNTESSFAELK